jgi:hypothetical protein
MRIEKGNGGSSAVSFSLLFKQDRLIHFLQQGGFTAQGGGHFTSSAPTRRAGTPSTVTLVFPSNQNHPRSL